MKKSILIASMIPVTLLTLIFVYASYLGVKESYDVNNWLQTSMVIKKAEAKEEYSRKRNVPFWCVRVEYEYKVNEKNYTGKRINPGSSECDNSKSIAEENLNKIIKDSNNKVFYDPADPARSSLLKRISPDYISWILMIFSIFIAIGEIILIFFLIKIKFKNN